MPLSIKFIQLKNSSKMKSLKFLICSMLVLACSLSLSAQIQYQKTISGKLVPVGKIATYTTANATPVVIDTLAIADNSAGIMEIVAVGSTTAGDGVTGKLYYRYKKVAGTLTVATAEVASAIVADTNVSGATFAFAATSYGNGKLTITGKAALSIKWRTLIKPYYNF
jgi:hypothetical protein